MSAALCKFKVGEQVAFLDKFGKKHYGVVRWIGTHQDHSSPTPQLEQQIAHPRDYEKKEKPRVHPPMQQEMRSSASQQIRQHEYINISTDPPMQKDMSHDMKPSLQPQEMRRSSSSQWRQYEYAHDHPKQDDMNHQHYDTNPRFHTPGVDHDDSVNPNLTVGSLIQMPSNEPTSPLRYGTIKWIGLISNVQGKIAGIELVRLLPSQSLAI